MNATVGEIRPPFFKYSRVSKSPMVWILCFCSCRMLTISSAVIPCFFQLQAVFYQNLFPNGGIQTVYDEDFAFIILGSDPGTLAGADSLLEIVTTMTVSPADTAFS